MANAKEELLSIVNSYMESADAAVRERLKTELNYITQDEEYIKIFIAMRGMKGLIREAEDHFSFSGSLGSSLIAYLLGVTEIDPIKYNLPFEVFAGLYGEKKPDIQLNFSEEFIPCIREYIEGNFPSATIWNFESGHGWIIFKGSMAGIKRSAKNPALWDTSDVDRKNMIFITFTSYSGFKPVKKLEDMTGVKAAAVPLDDKETIGAFLNPEISSILYFETDFARHLLGKVKPETFDDLVKIFGILHGTYAWTKIDNNTGEHLIPPEMPAYSEIIAHRDDILLYLREKGIDRAAAYEIMEKVKFGAGLSAEQEETMLKANVPGSYIESCNQTEYLWPKATSIRSVMQAYRLAWFKVHYPVEFQSWQGSF